MEKILTHYRLLCSRYKEIEKKFSEKDIHDKRVILMRISSILSLYKINASKIINGESSFKIYGQLHNIQVQILKLKKISDPEDIYEYLDFLKIQEIRYIHKIAKFCKKKHIEFPAINEKKIGKTNIERKVLKRQKKVIELSKLINKKDADSIHEFRIEFKKFRYALEFLSIVKKIDFKNYEKIKQFQDLLGEIHDYEILIKGITKFYGKESAAMNKNLQILKNHKDLKIAILIKNRKKLIDFSSKLNK